MAVLVPAYTQLIPIQELTPGAVGVIRNQVINSVVALACKEMNMTPDKLVVRDVRPTGDLAMYSAATTAATAEDWLFEPTGHAVATWHAACGANTMADQRYVAIFGVRNLGVATGIHATLDSVSTWTGVQNFMIFNPVASVKINVGGSDKVIWDFRSLSGYVSPQVAFSPSAIIIPQNSSFRIYYLFATASPGVRARVQLIGVAVEPRGKVISP